MCTVLSTGETALNSTDEVPILMVFTIWWRVQVMEEEVNKKLGKDEC